jgi:hypothetical protein
MSNDDDYDRETTHEWAERVWRENGEEVPERGSEEWQVKYEAFINYAFDDIRNRSKKLNAEKKRARRRGAAR